MDVLSPKVCRRFCEKATVDWLLSDKEVVNQIDWLFSQKLLEGSNEFCAAFGQSQNVKQNNFYCSNPHIFWLFEEKILRLQPTEKDKEESSPQ
ncbi:hypothetical protein EGR_08503 [Echinococcus granulosus]|uniref:Uncharacterized protein n=1 Tax=Echinococcus granulosus TaxID=6210 RepID=W6UEV3_ECHGR|nr:hypothetical protein EGR_08503 [Echinococcus granulosus]EUB56642.1 hypothetical protein EGR_08503 [Echinococcus granulosus]